MRTILLLTFFAFIGTSVFCQENWELQKDDNGIKVWTRDYPNSKFKEFKATAKLKAELKNVVAVFIDIENMGAWYDRIEKVTLVEKVSEVEGVYIIDFELPWPVADRISAVRSILTHNPVNNEVTVKTKYEEGVITNSDRLVITEMFSEWVLSPVDDGYVEIYHQGYMHPGGSLPAWIANSGVKDGPVKTIKALIDILPSYRNVGVSFLE